MPEARGNRDAILRVRRAEPEQGRLRQATCGRPTTGCSRDTSARGNESAINSTTFYVTSTLCQRASQDRLRERRDDGTQAKGIARGLRGTHGRGAPAEEGDVRGDGRG